MADARIALVTGGAVRIGRAISSALAEDGYRLVIHYNSSSGPADELVDEIRSGGGEAVAIGADLADADAVRRLASDAVDAFGGIDVLVNNASVFPSERLEETDEALWDHTMAVNLRAPFFLIRHLASTLRARKGVVINMADLAGIQAWAAYAAHGISKAGIVHLTEVAARSLAPDVRVNGIAPGTVLPPESMSDDEIRQLAERAPLKKNGSPEDVVRALRYLLAADFVTGQTLVVDGGRLLRG
ncbi:MAG TPA: SDR family oxidoreductase [Longimicrobium sp.]|nr:SDR family oxidoreductase [Longimicrobium sp.]